jgi:TolA-binding protein
MTSFRRGSDGDEDLIVASRRQSLDEAERRELDAALDADPTLRIAHHVGRAFDDVAFVRPGDEALIARAVDRTLGIGNRRVAAWRWRTAAAVAAGFVLTAGGVATAYRAGIISRVLRTPAVAAHHDVAPPAPRTRSRTARAERATETSTPVQSAAPVALEPPLPPAAPVAELAARAGLAPGSVRPLVPAPQASPPASNAARSIARPNQVALSSPRRHARPPTPRPPPVASIGASGGSVTPAGLFRRAGAARRTGALAEAATLYLDLQARFPAAEEAHVSHVSLGKLLLSMGRPQEAEIHFAIYLTGGGGPLAAEAAFGRAQGFERMGRPHEEREAWLGLLRDYPASIYASAARKRIPELEATRVSPLDAPGNVPAGGPSNSR